MKIENFRAADAEGVWLAATVNKQECKFGSDHRYARAAFAQGLVPAAYTAPMDPVPVSVESWRFKTLLQRDGLLQTVDDAVRANADADAVAAWDADAPIARKSPAVNQIADALGLDLDDLLKRAAKVTL